MFLLQLQFMLNSIVAIAIVAAAVVEVVVVVVAAAVKTMVQSSCILRLNQQLISSKASLRTAGNSRNSWGKNIYKDIR